VGGSSMGVLTLVCWPQMSPSSTGKFKNLPSEEREFLEALEESGEEVEDLMDGASREPSPVLPTPKKQKLVNQGNQRTVVPRIQGTT
jgi:hypothetical protein